MLDNRNASIGLRCHAGDATAGTAGRVGRWYAQNCRSSAVIRRSSDFASASGLLLASEAASSTASNDAPSSIQRRISSRSSAASLGFFRGIGGSSTCVTIK
jgi:ferric-dicitrate binding protein FerR (iron transport regulator)